MPFSCTICAEESTRICVWCTKDTCSNHLCDKCGRCSDCCECEVPLEEWSPEPVRVYTAHMEMVAEPAPEAPFTPALQSEAAATVAEGPTREEPAISAVEVPQAPDPEAGAPPQAQTAATPPEAIVEEDQPLAPAADSHN